MNHLTFSPLERVLAFLAGLVNLIVFNRDASRAA